MSKLGVVELSLIHISETLGNELGLYIDIL